MSTQELPMATRCYIRDGVPNWPADRQEEQLKKSGYWNDTACYRDTGFSMAKIKRKNAADLVERGRMLRPTNRQAGETIAVATMAVLAVDDSDLIGVFDAAAKRQATIICADTNSEFPPVPGAKHIARAMEERRRSSVAARTEGARLLGVERAAAKKRANSKRGIEAIREEWRNPKSKKTDAELYDEAGLSRRTIEKALGTRKAAQAEAQRVITRREKRHAAATKRKADQ